MAWKKKWPKTERNDEIERKSHFGPFISVPIRDMKKGNS